MYLVKIDESNEEFNEYIYIEKWKLTVLPSGIQINFTKI